MSKAVLAVIAVVGVMFLVALGLGAGYVEFGNDANRQEIGIQAQYTEMKNVYDNGYKKVLELAQVPEQQAAAIKELYAELVQGRGGASNDRALFRAITEQNPSFDQSTYVRVQQTIEAFRNDFQQRQTELISRKQAYATYLQATTSGRFYNSFANYPRMDLKQYDILTSARTEKAFDTKQDEPLNLRAK